MKYEQVMLLLEKRIAAAGNASRWAAENGIAASYVSEVINRGRVPGKKILTALGLEKEVIYRPIKRD